MLFKPHPQNVEILVSDCGVVFNKETNSNVKLSPTSTGYLCFWMFCKDSNKRKSELVHRAVYKSHIKWIPSKIPLNHIDGNKVNNNLNNLEESSIEHNNKHSRYVLHNSSGNKLRKFSHIEVLTFATFTMNIGTVGTAKLFNINEKTLRAIVLGQNYKFLNSVFSETRNKKFIAKFKPKTTGKKGKILRGVKFKNGKYFCRITIAGKEYRGTSRVNASEAYQDYCDIHFEWYGQLPPEPQTLLE